MRILLLNPPHESIGSRIPREHLPPLGLLSIGGPLIDDGHEVRLIDAEFGPMKSKEIIPRIADYNPDAVLLGHSGSTSAHPIVCEITRMLRIKCPAILIVYGGVFPTYHFREILEAEPQIDFIVRGEGEEIARQLLQALEDKTPLQAVRGIACRNGNDILATPPARPIIRLDEYRVGWELIDFRRYSYWGDKRAVVVQFSRGCPHQCSYCGQRLFWQKWRHRDPGKFAAELARLYREHGVEVINFADENPTSCPKAWKAFLEALIEEDVPLILVGSTRADDIVRDEAILPLYKKAGIARFLLGIENYEEATLRKIKKGSTMAKDRKAIRLLRKHGIISLATYAVGFKEERSADYWNSLKQLVDYDPDQIQLIYATPHRWTPFYEDVKDREVVEPDLRRWDYKHQVLGTRWLRPWQVLLWVKFMEAVMQLRPRALCRMLFHPDRAFREAMYWYYGIGRKVWFYEIRRFFVGERRGKKKYKRLKFQVYSTAKREY